jgi:hypothetical protein
VRPIIENGRPAVAGFDTGGIAAFGFACAGCTSSTNRGARRPAGISAGDQDIGAASSTLHTGQLGFFLDFALAFRFGFALHTGHGRGGFGAMTCPCRLRGGRVAQSTGD